jgi:hypothetical protein
MRKQATKTQAETLPAVPTLKTPKHGGGKLWMGAPANPVAGPGRPPNALRDAMRGDLDKLLPQLWAKYEAKEIDALELANFLAKYGLGTKDELSVVSSDVQARVAQTVQVVSELLPAEYAEPLLARLSEVWR